MNSRISTLCSEDGYVTDPIEMANLFQKQFASVFSNPDATGLEDPSFPIPDVMVPFPDHWLRFQDDEIFTAIKELKSSSLPGSDGIPAQLLKKCAEALVPPLKIIMQRSPEES